MTVVELMPVEVHHIHVRTTGKTDIIDITSKIRERTEKSSIQDGIATLFIPGSTAALTTIEYESGAVHDLADAIERMAPVNIPYAHDERWGDGNGYAHVRAALLGPSVQVPVVDGKLCLGTWQQLVLLDFDNRPRERHIIMQMIGE